MKHDMKQGSPTKNPSKTFSLLALPCLALLLATFVAPLLAITSQTASAQTSTNSQASSQANRQARTLDEALIGAYLSNPSLEAQRAGARYTDDEYVQARSAWLPQVSLGASWAPYRYSKNELVTISDQYFPITETVSLRQLIYDLGVTSGIMDISEAQARMGHEQLAAYEQELLGNVALLYNTILIERKKVKVLEADLERSETQDKAAQSRFEAGASSRSDKALASANLSASQATLNQAVIALERSEASFASMTGLILAQDAQTPSLSSAKLLKLSAPQLEALIIEKNPGLRALQQGLNAANAGRKLAEQTPLPLTIDVAAQASWTQGKDLPPAVNTQFYQALVNFNLTLYRGGYSGSARRQANNRLIQASSSYKALKRDLLAKTQQARSEVINSRAIVEAAQASLTASEIAYQGVETEAELGVRSQLELLDARQRLLDAENRVLTANLGSLRANIQLLLISGNFSPQALGLDVPIYSASDSFEETSGKFGYTE